MIVFKDVGVDNCWLWHIRIFEY